ncbi:hypothetical protein M2397_005915 [Pseudomonas sp. BIGb0381]|uniref:type IV secretion system protein VirB2 n=1 Tax=Pseudomonas TaxID=286 RepID=UPI0021677855|nr:type IV secretion system protein VirB2 [Pseudomonas sp. BIGb0381]MCS4315581.1 hypothetical protein [Pseudomonas sp. BIGb0381]
MFNVKQKITGFFIQQKEFIKLLVVAIACVPLFAMADWDQTVLDQTRKIRIGMYAAGGSAALISLLWCGIKWLLARANGDHSTTFKDYLEQIWVIIAVGGALVLAAGAWQIFGTGTFD